MAVSIRRVILVCACTVLVVIAVSISVIFWPSTPPDDVSKNVLVIIVDDFRPELGVYVDHVPGYTPLYPGIRTPNMDALASDSVVFTNAHAQYALCNPSRTSLLTSRRPDTTRVHSNTAYFREVGGNFTTLPQYFKEAGYVTAGMGKVFQAGVGGEKDPPSWSGEIPFRRGAKHHQSNNHSWNAVPEADLVGRPLMDQNITSYALSVLGQLSGEGGRPFLVVVGYEKPHLPFTVPESYLEMYAPGDVALAENNHPPEDLPSKAWYPMSELLLYDDISELNVTGQMGTTLPDFKALELRRAYYAAVSYVDGLVGEVLAELTRLGLDDNTVVALLGDHGWQLGEHSEWGKHTNFDIATRVPLMMKIPGKTDGGMVTDQLVELVDLFPTLAEAAGLPGLAPCPPDSPEVLTCTEGSSLMPLMEEGESRPWKEAAFTQRQPDAGIMGYSMRTAGRRYGEIVAFADQTGPDWGTVVGAELYDYEADPQGNYNVADKAEYKKEREALSAKLRQGWLSDRDNIKR